MAGVDNNYAPNNETTFVPFTIVITGTNDKPTLSATGGTITEQIGTGNTALDTVTGSVTFADVDLTDRPVVSAAISTTDPFRYYDAQGHDITVTLTPAQLEAILAVERRSTWCRRPATRITVGELGRQRCRQRVSTSSPTARPT